MFVTEAGGPTTTSWFLRIVQRTDKVAKLPFPVHPSMLRHSTGYKLANDGHALDRWRTNLGIEICNRLRGIRRWPREVREVIAGLGEPEGSVTRSPGRGETRAS